MRRKIANLGFTIIELLVVISVIGILAALLLARFGIAEKSARDTRRKSDLNQYRIALESYGIKTFGQYPSYTSTINASGSLCTALGINYMSSCLVDPREDGSTYFYRYQSNGSGGGNVNATQYLLWADLENGGFWYLCANGKGAEKTTTPISSDCW